MKFALALRKLRDRIENMRVRTRLVVLMLLFGIAVAINILALFFLARSVSSSLDLIESARSRQLVAVEMHEKLRNAEAALYRYDLEGEAGFATQFDDQIGSFHASVVAYESLASTAEERSWAEELAQVQQQADSLGQELIGLHDRQTDDLKTLIAAHAQLEESLLRRLKPLRNGDAQFQQAIDGMNESARGMLLAVTAYLASPDDLTRDQFADATARFQENLNQVRLMAVSVDEINGVKEMDAAYAHLQNLGLQLISGRDQQQALFARFFAVNFQAGQSLIVGKIQPLEAQRLAEAQQDLQSAVAAAILITLIIPLAMTVVAAWMAVRLARGMNRSILALLRGADRVAAGQLGEPVQVQTADELKRLAEAFNRMMADLATRERRLNARLAELETLRQVNLNITSSLDLDQVLNTIAAGVLGLVEASSVCIFTRDDAGALQLAASGGPRDTGAAGPDSLVATVAATGQSHVVNRMGAEAAGDASLSGAPCSAAFPMKLGEQVLGVLHISSGAQRAFTSEDLRVLNLLTDQAAVALGNARLYQGLSEREERVRTLMQKLAQIQDEERRLIGLDLHDGLTQLVISANMHLNTLQAMLAQTADPAVRHELEQSQMLTRRAIEEARRVIGELRPTVVEELGLAGGLRRYVIDICAAEGWQCDTQINLDGIELNPPAQAAIFRIAQEALSNARNHAKANAVRVQLQSIDGELVLGVQDSGCGFDPAARSEESTSIGLISMRERARMLGGACEIMSQPGHGTSISVRVPLAALQRNMNEQQ